MNYKVSVIIPCYNLEKYISGCILSICKQSYSNLEIIVINDGSIDNSLDVIQGLAQIDGRIKCINQVNGGVSQARNRGITEATGDMFMFVDGDDYLDSKYIENMVNAMNDKTDLVIAGITFRSQNQDIVVNGDIFRCDAATFFDKYYLQSIVKRTIFGPVNKLFRMKIIQDYGVHFLENLSIREDGLFVLEFLKHIKYVVGIRDAGYYYIQHDIGNSLVGKYNEDELMINALFYKELLSLLSNDSCKFDVISQINPMFLNMDFTSIMKYYSSEKYTAIGGIKYIYRVKRDQNFICARRGLLTVNFIKALKYYRPALVIHIVCFVKKVMYRKRK